MYWIIGGAQLFKELIDDVSYIHESVIENYFTCDTYVQPIPKHFVRCYYFNKCQYLRTIKDGKVIEDDLSEDEYDPPTERFSMRLFHNSEKERYIGFEQELEAIVGKTITRDSVFQHYPIKRGLPYEYHSEPRAQGTSNSNSEVY